MENKNNIEEWKDIEGYEGLYQVSNLGRVKSLDRIIYRNNGRIQTLRERILKPAKISGGYQFVLLSKDGKTKHCLVHRLVASAFIENPNDYTDVNHIDENKINNRVDNLEWCNRKYNMNYGTRNERARKAISKSLTNNLKRCKPVAQIDKSTGQIINIWPSVRECGRNGFHQGNICSCCRGEQKTSKGYIWKYLSDVV